MSRTTRHRILVWPFFLMRFVLPRSSWQCLWSEKKKSSIGITRGVREHCLALSRCGVEVQKFVLSSDIADICGIILPGGESTAIGKLLIKKKLFILYKKRFKTVFRWGTCAGQFFITIGVSILGILDIDVDRNAYGSQISSCIVSVFIHDIADDFPVVFIRAPRFFLWERGRDFRKKMVNHFCISGKAWANSFHPELTDDIRVHEAFVKKCVS